jgi:ribosomal protein L18E
VLKIPANFISVIINAVETGVVPSGVKGGGTIEDKVIVAAYAAFRSGLQTALLASGAALLIAAVVAATTLSERGQNGHGPVEAPAP